MKLVLLQAVIVLAPVLGGGTAGATAPQSDAAALEPIGPAPFKGKLDKAMDLSAASVCGEFLLAASDSGNALQVLRVVDDHFEWVDEIHLGQPGEDVDIEGIACRDDVVFVTGSHNRVRKKLKEVKRVEDLRARLASIEVIPSRSQFFRFRLTRQGKVSSLEKRSLRSFLDADPVLRVFSQVPCKENGIDIEGLAERDGKLYFGFRGPVLRDDFTPIVSCRFEDPQKTAQTAFVKLQGLGIRDLVAIDDGFLLVAGPITAAPGPFHLYYWNGVDSLTSKDYKILFLGVLATPPRAKPEGLAILRTETDHYHLLIVHDGVPGGAPLRYRLRKTWSTTHEK